MDTEKIYCMNDGNCNNAALYSAMNNNGWMNNPFAYMMFLALFRQWGGYGAEGVNGNTVQNAELMSRISSLENAMSDNHNTDLIMQSIQGNHDAMHELANNLNIGFRDVALASSSIQSKLAEVNGTVGYTGEKVINSNLLSTKDTCAAIKDCCCNTQLNILKMGYENQISNLNQTNDLKTAINTVGTNMERGFANVGFLNEQQTCAIRENATANTQRIIDTLNNHWNLETSQKLQDTKFELSQLHQNQYLISQLKTTSAA